MITQVSGSGTWTRGEIYAAGEHIATYENDLQTPTTFFTYADKLGTERVETAVNGSSCETITNTAFGDGLNSSGSCDPSELRFTGKQRDWETNLDDFGARFYSSQLGRFMSADWSAVPAPVPYANLSNPQTLNLYAMVSDNPETFADLDGHSYTAPTAGGGMDLTGAVTDLGGELGGFGELEIGDQYQPPASETQASQQIGPDYIPSGGVETLGVTAGRINNETVPDKDSKDENMPLSDAEKLMAHQRFNAERQFGSKVQGLSGMMDPLMSGPGYARALAATIAAAREDAAGADPTGGAFQYNMRTPAQANGQHTFWTHQVHTISGPYISSTPYKYIVTYGLPIYADPVPANRGVS